MSANPVAVISASPVYESNRSADFAQLITAASIFLVDLFALTVVFAIAVFVRHLVTPTYDLNSYFDLVPLVVMTLIGFWVQGLYPGALLHPSEEMRRIFVAVTTVFLIMACATFLRRNPEAYSRSVFLLTWAICSPLVLVVRYGARGQLSRQSWWGIPAVIIGSGASAHRVLSCLHGKRRGVKVVGVLSDSLPLDWPTDLPPMLGPTRLGPELAKSRFAQYAIVAVQEHPNRDLRHLIQDHCQGFRHVLLIPDMPGLCSLGVSTRELGGEMGLELPQTLFHLGPTIAKRLIDILLSALAITAFLPLLLAIAILVKLTSQGPIFFSHTRYGRDGRTFGALKFRTMLEDGERILADYLQAHPEDVFEWQKDHKLKNDPRITPIGKWLRRLSLDELPQLFNVIAGQMSLVGPRPIVKAEISKYGRGFALYARALPGITGLWQVSGRNNTTYQERIAFDEFYVNNWSVWLDAYILIRTIKVVLTAEGAY